MSSGSFLIGLVCGFLDVNKFELKKFSTKLWSVLLVLCYAAFNVAVKVFFIQNQVEPSIITALFGGYMKHHHGIFLSLFVSNFILGNEKLAKIFNQRTFRIAEKLFTSALLSSLMLTKFFISTTNILLEMSFGNMVCNAAKLLKLLFIFIPLSARLLNNHIRPELLVRRCRGAVSGDSLC